jgi:ubiquinone/menaquinone biosynthesis C-methylase UbiE
MSTAQTPWYGVGSSVGLSAAEAYEQYLVPAIFGPWAQDLVEFAAPTLGERVLDLACGTGVVARTVGSHIGATGKVTGVDLNARMLEVARSVRWTAPAPVEWREANALELPLDDGSFDLVLCQQGLQFFPNRLAALIQMRRILARGGRIALSVWRSLHYSPGFESLHNALTRHIGPQAGIQGPASLSDVDELRNLVSEASFRDVTIRQAAKLLKFPSPEKFVWQYVSATPLATIVAQIGDDARAAIVQDVTTDLREFVSAGGLAFPIESHLLTAFA